MAPKFQSTLLGDLEVDVEFDAQIGAMTYFSIGVMLLKSHLEYLAKARIC